jgi:hypothetical protein
VISFRATIVASHVMDAFTPEPHEWIMGELIGTPRALVSSVPRLRVFWGVIRVVDGTDTDLGIWPEGRPNHFT